MLRQKFFVLFPSLFAAAQVFAVSVYEPFSYPVGSDLAGQGGWVLTAGTTSPKVQAGSLAIPGLMPATDGNSIVFGNSQMEVRRFMKNEADFFTPGVGEYNGQYWYSLAFKVTDLGSLNTDGDFIAAFSSTNQTSQYGGLLYLRKDPLGTANGYNIGVSKDASAVDIAWSSTVYLTGQTNFVVCRYFTFDSTEDTLLWINPDPSTYGAAIGSEPPPTLTASSGLNQLLKVGQIVLHQASANPGLGSIIVDEIRVEGQWANVTPIPLTMSITQTNGTDVYMSWGGHQNDFIQQATNLTPPVTWSNLNSFPANARINSYTATNATSDPVPKFFRLVRWYAE